MENWPQGRHLYWGLGMETDGTATGRWEKFQVHTQVPIIPYLTVSAIMAWHVLQSLSDMLRFLSFFIQQHLSSIQETMRACQWSKGPSMMTLPLNVVANGSPLSMLLKKVRCEPCACPKGEQVQWRQKAVQRLCGREGLICLHSNGFPEYYIG